MLLCMKRTGSNHLMNALNRITNKKLVWFDAPPRTWREFGLPFSSNLWEYNPTWCLNELFDQYSGCKINWDEPAFFNIIDELLEYPIQKILLHRENIWEKVISEELAIQTNHWIAPIGKYRSFKNDYKYDALNVEIVKQKMDSVKSKMEYFINFIDDDFIVYSYEDLFSRNNYTNTHRDNFRNLLKKLEIEISNNDFYTIVESLMISERCYKTDLTYQNIANISELEKLKDYL